MGKKSEKSGKQWYRHRATGDLGHLVLEDGKQLISLDRGDNVVLRPFSPGDWIPEDEVRLMTPMQAAQVAFAADAELGRILRWNQPLEQKAWLSITPEEKIQFRDKGPKGRVRVGLWKAIMSILEEECRE
jgi:hypothetical protein